MSFLNYNLPINIIQKILLDKGLYIEDLKNLYLVNKTTYLTLQNELLQKVIKGKIWYSSEQTIKNYQIMQEMIQGIEERYGIHSIQDFFEVIQKNKNFYTLNWLAIWIANKIPKCQDRDNFINFSFKILNEWVYTAPELLSEKWNQFIFYIITNLLVKPFAYKLEEITVNYKF